ncbi:MAG: O-antigen ligase family protein [Colwellia sp.]
MKLALFLLVYYSIRRVTLEQLGYLFFAYIFVDFVVSIIQFIHFDHYLVDLIVSIYSTGNHAEFSLQLNSVRSLGLSPGPGQHGVISLLIFWFFSIRYTFERRSLMGLLGLVLAVSSLFMSQSKTCLIAFLASGIVFIGFIFVLKDNITRLMIIALLSITVFLIWLYFTDIMNVFYDISRVVKSGLETSSLIARVQLWEAMISVILSSNPVLILFGAGRSYLEYMGVYHGSFDNDFVYIFVQYGIIGFVAFVSFITFYLIRNFLKFNRLSITSKIIYMLLLSGVVSSLSIAFFIDLKILSILAILLAIENRGKTTQLGYYSKTSKAG